MTLFASFITEYFAILTTDPAKTLSITIKTHFIMRKPILRKSRKLSLIVKELLPIVTNMPKLSNYQLKFGSFNRIQINSTFSNLLKAKSLSESCLSYFLYGIF
ncbi:unnamed protein product [Schistosoma rodhaini]|uniref:Uncharacterized protein n=1 Tax=Schistosoma rodhaini TaxID=6188 RepID=A0AA85GEZ9_9TREM|nr:unnamed protein product [Schistosoma rodhaini]